jgi:prepilin-type N-terminal cleavage/methylation domain-containing protein
VNRRKAFTLVEMLVATVLAAILMGGVLAASSALARDRRRMEARQSLSHSAATTDLIRRDLANSAALLASSPQGFEILALGGIDPRTLAFNQRLTRISYRIIRPGVLVREQVYLDDPIRPDRWREAVATDVRRVTLTPLSASVEQVRLGEDVVERLRASGLAIGATAVRVPGRLRVTIEMSDGLLDQELVLR